MAQCREETMSEQSPNATSRILTDLTSYTLETWEDGSTMEVAKPGQGEWVRREDAEAWLLARLVPSAVAATSERAMQTAQSYRAEREPLPPTPRTDALIESQRGDRGVPVCDEWTALEDHARQLERELNAMRMPSATTGATEGEAITLLRLTRECMQVAMEQFPGMETWERIRADVDALLKKSAADSEGGQR